MNGLFRLIRPSVVLSLSSIPFTSIRSNFAIASAQQRRMTTVTMKDTITVYRGRENGEIFSEQIEAICKPNDVFVEITHSGVCGADELFLRSGIALGHEGIGLVRRIGSNVKSVQIGDRVGFSFVQEVCGSCDNCLSGMKLRSTIFGSSIDHFGEKQGEIITAGKRSITGEIIVTVGVLAMLPFETQVAFIEFLTITLPSPQLH